MQTVETYTYLLDAQLDQLKLGKHGIESFIADEHTVTMQWLYTNAIGGIRLQVVESNAAEAVAILKTADVLTSDTVKCQKCSSTDTFRMKMSFWSLPLYFLGVFFPIPSGKLICLGCGSKVPN